MPHIFLLYDGLTVLIKLLLCVVLAGLIGMERQHKHRPAGLRTHILVCIGAALTMMIGQFLSDSGNTLDVTRLGAQVISGIGFLGAGTIIRDGANVRGLTTAATLWAVACIGLAVGIGYYIGAVLASVLIFAVVKLLGKLTEKKKEEYDIRVTTKNTPEALSELLEIMHRHSEIKSMDFSEEEENGEISVTFSTVFSDEKTRLSALSEAARLGTVRVIE